MNISTNQLIYNHILYTNPGLKPEPFMLHSHNSYELLFFEKGDGTYVIEDRKYHLKKNDLVFIRPLLYHYIELKPNTEYARFNIAFDPSLVDKKLLTQIPENLEVINCPKNSIIADIFSRMHYYSNALDETAFADILQSLIKELLYNIQLTRETESTLPSELSPLLSQALEYMNDNLFTIKDIKEVCAKCFVSEQYLFRQFQTQLKITPKKYLNTKRLLHAQKMIQRGKKPIEIYQDCGFETYVGFYKQYLKTFGYSPSKEKNVTTL